VPEHSCCSNHAPASTAAGPLKPGVEHAGVIDLLVHDTKTDRVTITMVEPRPWDGSKRQLFQLQEKFNSYLSFILDGEMAEAYPTLVEKPLLVRLECATPPDATTIRMLEMVREQIAFQGIDLEVEVMGKHCGEGCGCGSGSEVSEGMDQKANTD
jgi:hypothetical protein